MKNLQGRENFDFIHTLSAGTIFLLCFSDLLKPSISIIIRDMQVLIQPYGKSEISLSFLSGFTEPVLNAVRRLPNRMYEPSQRIWIIPDSQECIDSLLQNLYLTGLFTYENANENQNYPKNTNDELIRTNVKF